MASRIHGDVYVRFRGRYAETCRRKAVRRCIPSLQTNYPEVQPEKWEKLKSQFVPPALKDEQGMYTMPLLDALIRERQWICPIYPRESDSAYYRRGEGCHIIVPLKGQFDTGESFYSTLLHEMAHSTGEVGHLEREKVLEYDEDQEFLKYSLHNEQTGFFQDLKSYLHEH